MIKEFPMRNWKKSTLCDLIKKIDSTGKSDRLPYSGQPRSARTSANIETCEMLERDWSKPD